MPVMKSVKAVRIVDPHVLNIIESNRAKCGESNPTKTAARMILERAAQLEILNRNDGDDGNDAPTPKGSRRRSLAA